MSAPKKPRKAYRPKWVSQNPIAIAAAGARRLDAIDIARFMLPLRGAVAAIVERRAERDDWKCVFDAVNTAEQLCPMLAGKDWRDWVEQTQADVIGAYDAGVLDAERIQALHGVADTFAEMLGVVTCRQLFEAQGAAARKINAALVAGKSIGNVRVIDPGEMRIAA